MCLSHSLEAYDTLCGNVTMIEWQKMQVKTANGQSVVLWGKPNDDGFGIPLKLN